MTFTDTSYPPISGKLVYERGDGAKIVLEVTPGAAELENTESTAQVTKSPDVPKAEKPAATQPASLVASTVVPKPIAKPIQINPAANINLPGKPRATRPGQAKDFSDDRILDHEKIGGKLTAFILFYGGDEYHDLHRKCLTSFLSTTPAERIDLRVGSNALCDRSVRMIEEQVEKGRISKHYRHRGNDYKYPVMREMFFDPTHPITTKWVLWFDDDSICDVEPSWLNILGHHIVQHHHGKEAHMIGAKYVWRTGRKTRRILESRPWYKGRPWRQRNGKPSPNGEYIIFATGGFWAITHELIVAADIPDLGTGLTHTGGDWQIGEQIYQAGYSLKQFNGQKQFVRTSSVPRRGVTMPTIGELPDKPPEISPKTPKNTENLPENPQKPAISDPKSGPETPPPAPAPQTGTNLPPTAPKTADTKPVMVVPPPLVIGD